MLGESMAARSDYGDEGRAYVEVEAELRQLDLARYPLGGDTSYGNDVILAAYDAGASPAKDLRRRVALGAGASGHYELADGAPALEERRGAMF